MPALDMAGLCYSRSFKTFRECLSAAETRMGEYLAYLRGTL